MSNTSAMKTFKPYNNHTVYLLPPAMDDWLPKGHLAYLVSDAIDHMDLSPFVASYFGNSRAGQPLFHPAMMLKILVYAYAAEYLEYKSVEAYIPPKKRSHREWRETPLVSGDPPDGSRKARMRWKLDTAEGRERYGLRKITVEPAFVQIKAQQGFRRFLLRGMEKAKAEWALACLAHNLRKMHRLGVAV